MPLLCLVLLGGFYLLMFNSYRAYEIDNPWYLSFSHNFHGDHFSRDYFLNGVFPDGMGGTPVFGRLAVLVQAAVLSHTGWAPVPATMLSILVVLMGLGVWAGVLKRHGLSMISIGSTVLALGLTEPFVGMAERFRFEPYAFFLMAAAFWLASRQRVWLALCVGLMALEIEPVAGLVFPAVAFYLVRTGKATVRQMAYGSIVAGFTFALIYGILHPDIVTVLRKTDWHRGSGQRQAGGFLRAYFVGRKRHLPELLLVLITGWMYVKKRAEAPMFVRCMAEITGFVCLISFAMSWPTPAYMVFFFPFFLVLAQWVLERQGWRGWRLAGIVALLMLPQYGVLAIVNHGEGWRSGDIRQVAETIRHVEQVEGLEDGRVRVMGEYSMWFAHPEHYRALARTTENLMPEATLFLCFESPLRAPAMVDPIVRYCKDIEARIVVREVASLDLRGHRLRVLVPRKEFF